MNLILILLVFLAQFTADVNFYNPSLDIIVCHDRGTCTHEQGHNLDHDLGDVSLSPEFQQAVIVYLVTVWNYPQTRSEFSARLVTFPGLGSPLQEDGRIWGNKYWGGWQELYASMYEWVDGDVSKLPICFQQFYSTERR